MGGWRVDTGHWTLDRMNAIPPRPHAPRAPLRAWNPKTQIPWHRAGGQAGAGETSAV